MTTPKRRQMALKSFEKFTKKPNEGMLKGIKVSKTDS
jgi:hypothetical protein